MVPQLQLHLYTLVSRGGISVKESLTYSLHIKKICPLGLQCLRSAFGDQISVGYIVNEAEPSEAWTPQNL